MIEKNKRINKFDTGVCFIGTRLVYFDEPWRSEKVIIYYSEGDDNDREELIISALRDYYLLHAPQNDYGVSFCSSQSIEIARTERGKPYLKGFPEIKFSVSHSGDRWICAVSNTEVGIDCELKDKRIPKYEKIAARHFCCSEGMLISDRGKNTFLRIWTRKEAYLKYIGTGLAGGLSSICTVKNGGISDVISGQDCIFTEVGIKDDMITTVCCLPVEAEKGFVIKAYSGAENSDEVRAEADWKIKSTIAGRKK